MPMGKMWAKRRRGAPLLLAAVLCGSAVATIGPASPAAAADPVEIYPLGDSITWGYTPTTASPGGYRAPLDAILTRAGVDHLFVGTMQDNPTPAMTATAQDHHDGHQGYRVDQDDVDLDGVAGGPTDGGGHWLTG